MKNTALKAFFGVVLASLTMLMVEAALWLINVPDRGIYDGDSATVWWLKANLDRILPHSDGHTFQVQTNALGLRGPLPPESGEWILALGCSTTFGWGVEAEESWPSVLSKNLDIPVINGGMPGWSTHQAKQRIAQWPDSLKSPSTVILAYWVRDAQLAPKADHRAKPTPWPFRLQLGRLMAQALQGDSTASATTARVGLSDYQDNLAEIKAQFPNQTVYGLFFPQKSPNADYGSALAAQTQMLELPDFSEDLFFDTDPIHLTTDGHQTLADALTEQLR